MKRVLVVGSSRSGTTLMGRAIGTHPDITIYKSENQILTVGRRKYRSLKNLSSREAFRAEFLRSGQFAKSGLSEQDVQECLVESDFRWVRFQKEFFDRIAAAQRKFLWIDTTPDNVFHLEDILREIPDIRVIHMVRDGRGAAFSRAKLGWTGIKGLRQGSISALIASGLVWELAVTRGRSFAIRHPENCIQVRFEDLVRNPGATMVGVEGFLGLEGLAKFAEPVITSSDGANSAFGRLSSPTEALNRWQKMLSQDQIEALEQSIGATLEGLGYELVTDGRPMLDRAVLAQSLRTWLRVKEFCFETLPLGRLSSVSFEPAE